MDILLGLSARFDTAIPTFDALPEEPLYRLLDPQGNARNGGRIPVMRVLVTAAIVLGPLYIFSAVPSPLFGGHLMGRGGLLADLAYYGIGAFTIAALFLIPLSRRALGDLVRELQREHLLGVVRTTFDSDWPTYSWLHKALEWMSRLNSKRAALWCGALLANQVFVYYVALTDSKHTWMTAYAQPGSTFFPLHFLCEQPNLAGLWCAIVQGPFTLYLLVVAARLFVAFACLCATVARSPKRQIDPSHPDGAGGLGDIGQVALLLSLLTFALGVDLAVMTANELLTNATLVTNSSIPHTNLHIMVGLWVLYLGVGSLLFFLPLAPLHERMAAAKRAYLLEIGALRAAAATRFGPTLRAGTPSVERYHEVKALDDMFRAGYDMAVWPYDKKTFIRYATVFLSPIIPLLLQQAPHVYSWWRTIESTPK